MMEGAWGVSWGWRWLGAVWLPFLLLACAKRKGKSRRPATPVSNYLTPPTAPPQKVSLYESAKRDVIERLERPKSETGQTLLGERKGGEEKGEASGLMPMESTQKVEAGKTSKIQFTLPEDGTQADFGTSAEGGTFDGSLDDSQTGDEEGPKEEGAYAAGDWKGLKPKTNLNDDVEVIFEPDAKKADKKGQGLPKEAIDPRPVNIEEQREKAKHRLITFLMWLSNSEPGPSLLNTVAPYNAPTDNIDYPQSPSHKLD